jgi:hypothetical protein
MIAQPVEWQGSHFELIDTGGMFGASDDPLHALLPERGRRAIADADLCAVTDGRRGLVAGDSQIAKVILARVPTLLAINRPTIAALEVARSSYGARIRSGSRVRPSTGMALAISSTRSSSSSARRRTGAPETRLRSRYIVGYRMRAVIAGQSVARGNA